MKLKYLLGWSSALLLSASIAEAQGTNSEQDLNKK
jgi:hypothetical protein